MCVWERARNCFVNIATFSKYQILVSFKIIGTEIPMKQFYIDHKYNAHNHIVVQHEKQVLPTVLDIEGPLSVFGAWKKNYV